MFFRPLTSAPLPLCSSGLRGAPPTSPQARGHPPFTPDSLLRTSAPPVAAAHSHPPRPDFALTPRPQGPLMHGPGHFCLFCFGAWHLTPLATRFWAVSCSHQRSSWGNPRPSSGSEGGGLHRKNAGRRTAQSRSEGRSPEPSQKPGRPGVPRREGAVTARGLQTQPGPERDSAQAQRRPKAPCAARRSGRGCSQVLKHTAAFPRADFCMRFSFNSSIEILFPYREIQWF